MPRRCPVYGCRGNYRSELYTKIETETRLKWITALPNDSRTLVGRKEIWICVTHFEGEWVTMRGEKRPLNPPSSFPGVTKSCLKQVQYKERQTTTCSSAEARRKSQDKANEQKDKIKDFKEFVEQMKKLYVNFNSVSDANEFSLYQIDKLWRKVILFLHFCELIQHSAS